MPFRSEIFTLIARGHCPFCKESIPSSPSWDIAPVCTHCGLVFRRSSGFFLGALVWNYGMIAVGGIPLLALMTYGLNWLTWKQAVWVAVTLGLTLPWFLHRLAWRLWIASYYCFLPDQIAVDQKADTQRSKL